MIESPGFQQKFICICFRNIHAIWKIHINVLAVIVNAIECYFFTFVFWSEVYSVSKHWIPLRLHYLFLRHVQTAAYPAYFQLLLPPHHTYRHWKHILIFCQHIILDFQLVMIQCGREQKAKHQKQICKYDPHKKDKINCWYSERSRAGGICEKFSFAGWDKPHVSAFWKKDLFAEI